jgi:hypothetical protein
MCFQNTVVGQAWNRYPFQKGEAEKKERVTGLKQVQNPTGQTTLYLKAPE